MIGKQLVCEASAEQPSFCVSKLLTGRQMMHFRSVRVVMCELEALMRQTPDFLLDDCRTFKMPMGAIYFCVADSWLEPPVSEVCVVVLWESRLSHTLCFLLFLLTDTLGLRNTSSPLAWVTQQHTIRFFPTCYLHQLFCWIHSLVK